MGERLGCVFPMGMKQAELLESGVVADTGFKGLLIGAVP